MPKQFLAGLTRAQFLRRHWQKSPLLARDALPDYSGSIGRDELFALAARAEFESRIVTRARGRWRVRHGPFAPRDLRRMPRTGWTLLVQGTEIALSQAARLLRVFDFIPYARLDDVMVSYAAPGGGVGPHFDSYDVFLVQTHGERRWRVSAQRELDLVTDAPLKILKNFVPEREWTLGPGDVLYLPPRYAHDGVAVNACITCSVGFRAPSAQELAQRFLEFLQDRLALEGQYGDRKLKPVRLPAAIPASLVRYATGVTNRARWRRRDVVEFLGRYLSEPKDSVVFERPGRGIARDAFSARAAMRGLRLAAATRMLFHGRTLFMNGEAIALSAAAARPLSALANHRTLNPHVDLPQETWTLLYDWYLSGYIDIDSGRAA
jgi:50S ribosomal protein L16 3-hydroxylase